MRRLCSWCLKDIETGEQLTDAEYKAEVDATHGMCEACYKLEGDKAFGLCPKCGAHLENWKETFGEDHTCPGEL